VNFRRARHFQVGGTATMDRAKFTDRFYGLIFAAKPLPLGLPRNGCKALAVGKSSEYVRPIVASLLLDRDPKRYTWPPETTFRPRAAITCPAGYSLTEPNLF
jgi:hypothetical protein